MPTTTLFGNTFNNVDALSQLPRPVTTTADRLPGNLIDHLSTTTVNVKEWTSKDSTLSQVKHYTLLGWPDTPLGEEFKPYQSRAHELSFLLSVLNGCVLWGAGVVVPP